MSRRTLTFSEIFSKTKSLIQELWKTPPTHPWYNRQAPGGALPSRRIESSKQLLATPDHLLFCAGLERGGHLFQSSFGVRFPEDSWAHGPGLACG
ncbi:hypothetical protein TNCV_753641 [Trichonephila clavipes]|nr:hypothetical protein TNCV_753641 [Trichonephila clavipes]